MIRILLDRINAVERRRRFSTAHPATGVRKGQRELPLACAAYDDYGGTSGRESNQR
jgi:hypothetical protein